MLFQFPTEWNSTLWNQCVKGSKSVSIPNGMEFYQRKQKLYKDNNCFNSQRDEILRLSRLL